MADQTGYRYRLLAETVTEDDDGQLVAGSHGILNWTDTYVPMDGITGHAANAVLADHTRHVDTLADVRHQLAQWGPADHIEPRGDNAAIVYLADTRPDVDEPYVSAIYVEGLGVAPWLDTVVPRHTVRDDDGSVSTLTPVQFDYRGRAVRRIRDDLYTVDGGGRHGKYNTADAAIRSIARADRILVD